MVRYLPILFVPLAGLGLALGYRRSFAARVVGVSVAVFAGAYSIVMFTVAHRVAELFLEGNRPSADWERGVDRMRSIIALPTLLALVVFIVLAVIALVPHRVVEHGKESASRPQLPGS